MGIMNKERYKDIRHTISFSIVSISVATSNIVTVPFSFSASFWSFVGVESGCSRDSVDLLMDIFAVLEVFIGVVVVHTG
jgi:hypothetical protein